LNLDKIKTTEFILIQFLYVTKIRKSQNSYIFNITGSHVVRNQKITKMPLITIFLIHPVLYRHFILLDLDTILTVSIVVFVIIFETEQ